MAPSTRGTPALDYESRANTVDSKDTFVQVDDVKDFKPEIDMKEDFDVDVSFTLLDEKYKPFDVNNLFLITLFRILQ